MSWRRYQRVLSNVQARRILVLGALLRLPVFGLGVLLTVHVVEHLGRSWKEAGVVSAAATLAIAISAPWRGRLLDRIGLRRTVLPSVAVTAACWSIAPFLPYAGLLVLAVVAGLFAFPVFTVARQGVMAATAESDRRTGLALDGMLVEVAYMIGPAGVMWAAAAYDTPYVLLALQGVAVAVGAVTWWLDPPMRAARPVGEDDVPDVAPPRSSWLTPRFVVTCLVAAASTIVLIGSEVSVVAALRQWDAQAQLGLVFAGWGLGSIVGGLVYGALPRAIPPYLLLGGLALVTLPMALATSPVALALLAFVAGLLCAPTVTATVDVAARQVPEAARGEAMGWHGSAMTIGSAVAAPLAGVFLDWSGYAGGVVAVSLAGLLIAVVAALLERTRRHGRRGWFGRLRRPEASALPPHGVAAADAPTPSVEVAG